MSLAQIFFEDMLDRLPEILEVKWPSHTPFRENYLCARSDLSENGPKNWDSRVQEGENCNPNNQTP